MEREMKREMKIKGYDFKLTCSACPEQYDVFDSNGTQVAYVHLRWGGLYASCPDCGGETVYSVDLDHNYGSFDSDEERMRHLNAIADAIQEHYLPKQEIKTVGDLIKALQALPQDARISYDYGLPVTIDTFDDGYTIC
jgi:hypothetical protein